jgi:hypothetical protein
MDRVPVTLTSSTIGDQAIAPYHFFLFHTFIPNDWGQVFRFAVAQLIRELFR